MTEQRNGHKTNQTNGNGRDQAAGADETLRNPGNLDFKKAKEGLKKIVRENQEWLKEMADR
jgi:hypothetical protein